MSVTHASLIPAWRDVDYPDRRDPLSYTGRKHQCFHVGGGVVGFRPFLYQEFKSKLSPTEEEEVKFSASDFMLCKTEDPNIRDP